MKIHRQLAFTAGIGTFLILANLLSTELRAQPTAMPTPAASSISEKEEMQLSRFIEILDSQLTEISMADAEGMQPRILSGPDDLITPTSPEDGFPDGPSDGGLPIPDIDTGGLDLPYLSRKSGAANIIAAKTLLQTLLFYGVVHVVETNGSRKTFKVIQSRSGYFKDLTTIDVAFAMQTFSNYIVALLCNDPHIYNMHRLLTQLKDAEIGLRFKYDMAWALLGNYLPREANDIYRLGTQWRTFSRVAESTSKMPGVSRESASSLKQWFSTLSQIIGIANNLSKLTCFVDVRPDPREELIKRQVIESLLEMQKETREAYEDIGEVVDLLEKETREAQLTELRRETPPQ